jgi:hypothetical protein
VIDSQAEMRFYLRIFTGPRLKQGDKNITVTYNTLAHTKHFMAAMPLSNTVHMLSVILA